MSNASSKEPAPTKSVMKTPWNPWLGLLFVAVVFYAAQITGGLLVSIVPSFRDFDSVGAQFAFILAAESLSIGALYLFLRRYKLGFAAIGLRKPKWSDLGYGLMSVPVYFLIYVVTVAVVTHLIPGLDIHQEQQLGFDDVKGALPLILTFISLVVLPPLTEELLVRGFLYSSLKKAMPLVAAVITTSALFAIAHLPEGGAAGPLYIAAIDTFILSLVLIYLREKTDGLWASITLHAVKNGIAFTVLFIFHVS